MKKFNLEDFLRKEGYWFISQSEIIIGATSTLTVIAERINCIRRPFSKFTFKLFRFPATGSLQHEVWLSSFERHDLH